MGAVNKGARSLDGEIIGVIHEKWCVDGHEDHLITNMIIVGKEQGNERTSFESCLLRSEYRAM
jgi:predicted Rossmann-fold nucleotide-binding protein